jgi:hypothetical protein
MTQTSAGSLPASMQGALHEARQVHVALEVDGRPHVTPELFTWSSGKLWFASAPSTYKSRHLDADDALAAVVRLPARDLLLRGVIERHQVTDLVRHGLKSVEAAAATARFAVRNASDLLAFAGDALSGRAGRRVPEPRVLFALEPSAAVLLENEVVIEEWGWASGSAPEGRAPAGGSRAVAAFPGPAAVPARWFSESTELHVSPSLLELYDIADGSPVAVVLDDYNAPGPAAKSGSLLHGTARAESEPGRFTVEVDREVGWDGTAAGPTGSS